MHFTRKFSRGPRVPRREHCWSYVVSAFENTTKNLVDQGRVQLEHSSQIVKVVSRLHANTSIPDIYWREQLNGRAHLELLPQEPWYPGKGAKTDRIIQLNCGELCTHASYKTNRTWENFNNRGIKMILLPDKLWLIANNSNSFANGSKSIITNNLGLCKHSEIYLI